MPFAPLPPERANPAGSPAEQYARRRERCAAEAAQLGRRSERLANLRLLLFLAALAVGAAGLLTALPNLLAASLLPLAGFVGLVRLHRRVEQARRRQAGLARINQEAGWRLARNWAALPVRPVEPAPIDHPYAADLDLLGPASLFQLLDGVGTWLGERSLRSWLLAPADPIAVRQRQAAVSELAPRLDLRDELIWLGRAGAEARLDPTPILAWAEASPWLAGRPGLLWFARLSPPLLLTLLAAQLAGLLAWPLFLLPLALNLWLSQQLVRPALSTIRLVAALSDHLAGYGAALALVAATPGQAPAWRSLQARLGSENGPAAPAAIQRLRRLAALAQPTTSQLYPLIELATLWNVHVLDALERWQRQAGRRVRDWLAVLGEAEALAALAGLRHAHPDWVLPDLDPSADRLVAVALAHPLLPDRAATDLAAASTAVPNPLELGPSGSFLLVTGSNMSGKSTLLRAIGLNVVLAQAGGPVCASSLRLPPVALWTCMRVADSLEQGVSYFMAELRRLKQVVDAAPSSQDSPPLLYLLDEILQGTNTAERQIAARRIIRLLLSRPALGAVSTHDLTLADSPDLAAAARAVHFSETVAAGADGPLMTFDYRLRSGLARSTNALRLLELVGLPPE
jgi:MutS-like protein